MRPDLETVLGEAVEEISRRTLAGAVDRARTLDDLGRRATAFARAGHPASWDADFTRRWRAAREVSEGTATTVHVAAWLAHSRRCHALAEGYEDLGLGLEADDEEGGHRV